MEPYDIKFQDYFFEASFEPRHSRNGQRMIRIEPTYDGKQWFMMASDFPVVWFSDVSQEPLKNFVFMITARW